MIKLLTFILLSVALVYLPQKGVNRQSKRDVPERSVVRTNKGVPFCHERESFNIDSVQSISGLERVQKGFYQKYLESYFKQPFEQSQLYFYSRLNSDSCSRVILQVADQSPEALYLFKFSSDGSLLSAQLLAKKIYYPGSETDIRSEILDNSTLKRFRIESYVGDYIEKEDRYTEIIDSIYQEFKISDQGGIIEIKSDSVRTIKK